MHKYRSHKCSEIGLSNENEIVKLSGWVHRKRDHGNLLFLDLRDHYGIIQCVVQNDSTHFKRLEKLIEIEKIAVNINSEELQSQVRDFKDIKEFTSGNIEVISMEDDILSEIKQARIGVELWRYFLYVAILLLMLEMIISNAKKQR